MSTRQPKGTFKVQSRNDTSPGCRGWAPSKLIRECIFQLGWLQFILSPWGCFLLGMATAHPRTKITSHHVSQWLIEAFHPQMSACVVLHVYIQNGFESLLEIVLLMFFYGYESMKHKWFIALHFSVSMEMYTYMCLCVAIFAPRFVVDRYHRNSMSPSIRIISIECSCMVKVPQDGSRLVGLLQHVAIASECDAMQFVSFFQTS